VVGAVFEPKPKRNRLLVKPMKNSRPERMDSQNRLSGVCVWVIYRWMPKKHDRRFESQKRSFLAGTVVVIVCIVTLEWDTTLRECR
jgi:hypothetical protein